MAIAIKSSRYVQNDQRLSSTYLLLFFSLSQGELVEIELDKEHSRVLSASFKSGGIERTAADKTRLRDTGRLEWYGHTLSVFDNFSCSKDGAVVKFHPHALVLATGAWTPRLVSNAVKEGKKNGWMEKRRETAKRVYSFSLESARAALLEPLKPMRGKLLPMVMIRGKEVTRWEVEKETERERGEKRHCDNQSETHLSPLFVSAALCDLVLSLCWRHLGLLQIR